MVFSAIHERVKVMDESTRVIIMGDLSARFGEMVRNLPRQTGNIDTSFYDYPSLPDPVSHPTENAISIMATRCSEECLLVVNNLKTPTKHFHSKLTHIKALE